MADGILSVNVFAFRNQRGSSKYPRFCSIKKAGECGDCFSTRPGSDGGTYKSRARSFRPGLKNHRDSGRGRQESAASNNGQPVGTELPVNPDNVFGLAYLPYLIFRAIHSIRPQIHPEITLSRKGVWVPQRWYRATEGFRASGIQQSSVPLKFGGWSPRVFSIKRKQCEPFTRFYFNFDFAFRLSWQGVNVASAEASTKAAVPVIYF